MIVSGYFLPVIFRKQVLEILNGFNEIEVFGGHYDLDGVEVPFAAKTAGKVCFTLCGSVMVKADRAKKTQVTLTCF